MNDKIEKQEQSSELEVVEIEDLDAVAGGAALRWLVAACEVSTTFTKSALNPILDRNLANSLIYKL